MSENDVIDSILSSVSGEVIKLLTKYPNQKDNILSKLTKFTSTVAQRTLLTKYDFVCILYSYLREHYNIIKILKLHIPDYDEIAEFGLLHDHRVEMTVQFDFSIVKIQLQYSRITCKTKKNNKPLFASDCEYWECGGGNLNYADNWRIKYIDDVIKLSEESGKFAKVFSQIPSMYKRIKKRYFDYPIRDSQKSVHTLLLCRNKSSDHPLMLMDKNITLIIAKYLWSTRKEDVWTK